MSTGAHSEDWAAHLKAINLAFAEREWQLDEAVKATLREHNAAEQRLAQVEQQVSEANAALLQLRSQLTNHEEVAARLSAQLLLEQERSAADDSRQRLMEAEAALHQVQAELANRELAAKALADQLEALRHAQHAAERASLERERRATDDSRQRLEVAMDSNASLLETLAKRERHHVEQVEGFVRRLADAELQFSIASAADAEKAAASATLQGELQQTRADFSGAQYKLAHHTQLLAAAQSEINSQQQALAVLSAEHTRMNNALRATLDAYARQVQVLQSEQVRLKGLPVVRLSEGLRRLFGKPARAIEACEPFVDGMVSTGPFAGTEPTTTAAEPHSTAFKSERPVAPTSKTTITHVHQLMALRGHAFVDSAYASLLNRRPDAGGLEYYLTRMRTDQDKAQVLIELASSDEGRARNKSLVGLNELIDARDARKQRLRRWLLRRPVQDQTLARIEANIGAMGDEFDVRLQAMDQRLAQLSRTLDGVVTLLSAKIETVGKSVEVASSLMAGDAEAVAKARLALFESQSLVAQTLQTGHSSAGSGSASASAGLSAVAAAAPTADALSCYLTAEAGSTRLIDSLSRHLATTTQAKTLSTN